MLKPTEKFYLIIIMLNFLMFSINSQTVSSYKKQDSIHLTNKVTNYPLIKNTLHNNTVELHFCDADGDGFMEFNIENIQEEALQITGFGNDDNEAIMISSDAGYILKINTPSLNPIIEEVCYEGLFSPITDIAVDKNKKLYVTNFGAVFDTDVDCTLGTVLFTFDFGNGANALSFDTQGNMYYGTTGSSEVYRYNQDELTPPFVWHDFGSGSSGGDFVMLNGKMYIAWRDANSNYKLYEVIVDESKNYISHIDLGTIKDNTYGLASELGKLYGVTPTELYRIDLDNFNFETVLINEQPSIAWWGAAGLHEAVILESTAFINYDDANNNINPLPTNWTNTIYGGQIIYVRIENTITGEYEVVEASINIHITPQLVHPNDLRQCFENFTLSTFDLTEVENELLANVNQDVNVSYYLSSDNAWNDINSIDSEFLSNTFQQTIYTRAQNIDDECFNVSEFDLIINKYPEIEPLSDITESRFLDNCYIDKNNQGYFKLDEIYDQIILKDYNFLELEYYKSFTDAESSMNEISNEYFASIGAVEELFVKVTTDEGCSKISNFFINGDCILTTTNISGIFFPKFFTPNGDGFNDYWNVKGISEKIRMESTISIYDRYGKLLSTFNPFLSLGWDGTSEGKLLSPNDYWYRLITPLGKIFNGHFSVIR